MNRSSVWFAAVLTLFASIAACGGDGGSGDTGNGGGGNGAGGGGDGRFTGTPYIPPPSYAANEVLAKLTAIEGLVETPNGAFVALAQVDQSVVQERIARIRFGVNETSGLDDVRIAMENADRIGAGEYLYNLVIQYAAPPLSDADKREIDEATLDQIDVNHTFDEDHSDGMPVSGVFREAILLMIDLWYRI